MSVEIQKTEDVIITSTENVSVGLKSAEDVQGNSEVAVEAKLKKWTVVGDDIYIANQVDTLPLWFQSILDTQISNSTLAGGVDLLTTNFNNFETGYNQTIVEINNGIDGLTSNVNTLLNDNGINQAAILDIQTTKVDANGAAAAAQTVIGAWENDPLGGGAFFEEKVFATKSLIESAVDTVEIIQADYGGVSAKVQSLENVSVAPDGSWTAGVSKLITAPDGGITGWEFTDGSNTGSDMSIYATNFRITDGTTNDTPFSISGNNVNFNGVVDFTNTNIASGLPGSTTINGGLVKTGRVESSNGTTYIDLDANQIKMYNSATGFTLNSTAAGTSIDPTIFGGYIKGGTLEAPNIISQDLIVVEKTRNTAFYSGTGSFGIESITFTIDKTKDVIIQIDTHCITTVDWSSTTNAYSDKFQAVLKRKIGTGSFVQLYGSPATRMNQPSSFITLSGSDSGGDFITLSGTAKGTGTTNIPHLIPLTHTYIETNLAPGTYTYSWEAIQTDGTGDNVSMNFSFRSIVATIIEPN